MPCTVQKTVIRAPCTKRDERIVKALSGGSDARKKELKYHLSCPDMYTHKRIVTGLESSNRSENDTTKPSEHCRTASMRGSESYSKTKQAVVLEDGCQQPESCTKVFFISMELMIHPEAAFICGKLGENIRLNVCVLQLQCLAVH